MSDPLSLLRKFTIEKKEIIERDDQITFGELSWPKNAKTNYILGGPGKDGSAKDYYTLECLLYLIKNKHLFHPVYVKQATVKRTHDDDDDEEDSETYYSQLCCETAAKKPRN